MHERLSEWTQSQFDLSDQSIGIPTADNCMMIDLDFRHHKKSGIRILTENSAEIRLLPDEARAVAEALLDFAELAES